MKISFKASAYKEQHPYVSKILVVIFVLAILGIAEAMEDSLQLINYLIYALFVVLIFLGIYFIYYKLYGSQYDIPNVISFDDEFVNFQSFKYHWSEITDIQVMYRSHYVIRGQEYNEINEFNFKCNGKQHNFHFALEHDEDLSKYIELLQ